MPCYRPIEIRINRINAAGREFLEDDTQVVPCGSCIGCRAEQSRQWAVRIMHEARLHEHSQFITLTIDEKHLNEHEEIRPRDLSAFVKTLRKTQQRRISYYACGEYGELTARPHYHAILFGYRPEDRDMGFDTSRPDVWRSQTLSDIWGRGICEGGAVTMASAQYVAGYMRKKLKQRHQCRTDKHGVLKQEEFARMSRRPAIGLNWIKKYWWDVYPRDFVVVDGYEAKPPRYYDKYMQFTDDKGGTQERRDLFEEVQQQRYLNAEHLSEYQMIAGEKIHHSRVNLFNARNKV